jgi:hypothetical protein
MRTYVKMKNNDKYSEWKKNDRGYISGYVVFDNIPHVAVIIKNKIIFCKSHELEIEKELNK